MVSVQKRDGENSTTLIFRFTKKVRRSGLLQEVRKRRFRGRGKTKRARKLSAIYRSGKKEELSKAKKMGLA